MMLVSRRCFDALSLLSFKIISSIESKSKRTGELLKALVWKLPYHLVGKQKKRQAANLPNTSGMASAVSLASDDISSQIYQKYPVIFYAILFALQILCIFLLG
jgi:hypothetical protein